MCEPESVTSAKPQRKARAARLRITLGAARAPSYNFQLRAFPVARKACANRRTATFVPKRRHRSMSSADVTSVTVTICLARHDDDVTVHLYPPISTMTVLTNGWSVVVLHVHELHAASQRIATSGYPPKRHTRARPQWRSNLGGLHSGW